MAIDFIKVLESPLFFWFAWAIIMSGVFFLLNKLVKPKNRLNEKDIKLILNEKFPKIYGFYRTSLIIIALFGFTLLGIFLFIILTKILIIDRITSSIYFNYSEFSGFLWAMIFMFLGIILIGLIGDIFGQKYSRFGRYLIQANLSSPFSIRKRISFEEERKSDLRILIIYLLIFAPLLFLALGNYNYVTENGVTYNSFFSLKEQHYEWADVQKVEAYPWIHEGNLFFNYLLYFDNKTEVNIGRTAILSDLRKIDTILHSRNITFDYSEIEPGVANFIENRYRDNPERLELIREIYKI